jgi:mercuric reductase
MAAYGARIAAENALNGDGNDASAMPSIVFTDPQVASVGLTEAQARDRGISVKTSVLPLDQVPRALAARDTRGLVKLVAEGARGKLLGAHLLAPEGADSIQTAALAIKVGLTIEELAEMIFPNCRLTSNSRPSQQVSARSRHSRLPDTRRSPRVPVQSSP